MSRSPSRVPLRGGLAPVRGALRDVLSQWPSGMACLALCATLGTILPAVRRILIDLRTTEDRFEPWRLFTGHLVHGSLEHLALNLSLFVPLGASRELRVGTFRFFAELAVLALGVSLGVRWLHADWTSYCGLSGVVYGLLTVVLLGEALRLHRKGLEENTVTRGAPFDGPLVAALIVAVLGLKTLLEGASGGWIWHRQAFENALGVVYLSGSHAAGMAAGLMVLAVASLQGEGAAASQPSRNLRAASPGSGASSNPPIMAAPAAPALRSDAAASGVTAPSA